MRIIRNFIVAFALYSRIPMPVFTWEKEDMRYNLVFLPFVGLVIGAVEYLCLFLLTGHELPEVFMIAILSLIPLVITGGFHVDGFMDTQDAFNSYKSREEKLEILKDPHIGAFSVISLVAYIAVWAGAMSLYLKNQGRETFICFAGIFVISRAVSGISAITMKKAKKGGMLNDETRDSGKGCIIALSTELLICAGLMLWSNPLVAAGELAAEALFFVYYRSRSYKEFGGVTGDTAGYLVTVSELVMLCGMVAVGISGVAV